jgi:aspartyl-tRNA(Asn)/glutamyl-tRNA(Gln) amidotransferase subunit C
MDKIHHIAMLARINLTEKEEHHLGADLDRVLSYIDKLQEIDMLKSKECDTASLPVPSNIMRLDEEGGDLDDSGAMLLESAPDHDGTFVKVKSVMKK